MIEVRPATPADEDAVFVLAAALATSVVVQRTAYAPILAELVAGGDHALAVATAGDRVVGYLIAHAHRSFHANGVVVWVDELMVDEPARHQGTGRALMRHAEQRATSRAAVRVTLATRRAAPFYAALGYTASATYLVRDLPPETA